MSRSGAAAQRLYMPSLKFFGSSLRRRAAARYFLSYQ
jgi:hypothetical protein